MKRISQWVLMFYASAFSLSYFFWSENYGNLFGNHPENAVAMGFPFRMFDHGFQHASPTVDAFWFAIDVVVGVVTVAIAMIFEFAWSRSQQFQSNPLEPNETNSNQFAAAHVVPASLDTTSIQSASILPRISLKQLLVSSCIIAAILATIRHGEDYYQTTLRTICVVGPVVLAWCFYLLESVTDKARLLTVFFLSLLMILAAAVSAEWSESLRDFTRGMLAIVVCWVPVIWMMAIIGPITDRLFNRS